MKDSSQILRSPTADEIQELKDLLCPTGVDELTIDCAYIAVFENYVTDSPGFAGKLMSVVWGGSPSTYDVYIWDDGKLQYVERD